jgi:hypothetical protein
MMERDRQPQLQTRPDHGGTVTLPDPGIAGTGGSGLFLARTPQ